MPYKFEKEDLLKLLIRAYDEGNYGFLDLSESVAEKLIEENQDKFEEEFKGILPNWPTDNMPTINDVLNPRPSMIQFPEITMPSYTPSYTVTPGDSFTISVPDGGVFVTRNFSDQPIEVDTIHITSDEILETPDILDNLSVDNSNQIEAEGSLLQKQLD